MSDPRIVYTVSRAHSGSTLLDLLLASHSGIISVGEAKMFAREPEKHCTCGADHWYTCPFWTQVDRVMKSDGGPGVGHPDIESDDPEAFTGYNRRFFRAVYEVSGRPVILDSSKDFSRLERFLKSDLKIDVIHLLRHPCGVVLSNTRQGGRIGRECRMYVREHLRASYALRNTEHIEVLYEHLARDPEREIRRILHCIDMEFEPDQFIGWKGREKHNFGGNRMRFDSSDEIRLDDKWRRELSVWQKAVVLTRTFPARFRHGAGVRLMHRLAVASAQER